MPFLNYDAKVLKSFDMKKYFKEKMTANLF